MEDDTDGDGILDGTEDLDRNGRVDSSGADPLKRDTDGDGLCDGLCSGKGEDQDKDGVRDQNADGDWTETDFLGAVALTPPAWPGAPESSRQPPPRLGGSTEGAGERTERRQS